MNRRTLAVAALGLVVAAPVARNATAQGRPARYLNIDIAVDTHNAAGQPWDVLGGAPDIALCTHSAFGQHCYGDREVNDPAQFNRSRCPDTFSCTFFVEVPATGPFTVTIWDVDIGRHDPIGVCILRRPGRFVCERARVTVRPNIDVGSAH